MPQVVCRERLQIHLHSTASCDECAKYEVVKCTVNMCEVVNMKKKIGSRSYSHIDLCCKEKVDALLMGQEINCSMAQVRYSLNLWKKEFIKKQN